MLKSGVQPTKDGVNTLRIIQNGVEKIINTKNLVLCTGAYDRTLPFPGWDTPGVMTPGGVQSLLKGHGVLAGKKSSSCRKWTIFIASSCRSN